LKFLAKQRIVFYVCDQCGHTWAITTDAPNGLLQHNGAVWIVSSHIDGAHHFEHLANAMKHANHLRDQHLGEERLRVILHRADSPLAK
jgi:hypothetical protein